MAAIISFSFEKPNDEYSNKRVYMLSRYLDFCAEHNDPLKYPSVEYFMKNTIEMFSRDEMHKINHGISESCIDSWYDQVESWKKDKEVQKEEEQKSLPDNKDEE